MIAETPLGGFRRRCPKASFSHALAILPSPRPDERARLIAEMARVLAPAASSSIGSPLSWLVGEVAGLRRECARKARQRARVAPRAGDGQRRRSKASRRNRRAGLQRFDVTLRPAGVEFSNGRAFKRLNHRLLLMPQFRKNLDNRRLLTPSTTSRDAIDKYWSEGEFELQRPLGSPPPKIEFRFEQDRGRKSLERQYSTLRCAPPSQFFPICLVAVAACSRSSRRRLKLPPVGRHGLAYVERSASRTRSDPTGRRCSSCARQMLLLEALGRVPSAPVPMKFALLFGSSRR